MDALDLTAAPPRSPRLALGGLFMLARTIDKVRATLPGGKLGDYQLHPGFSSRMFETLGLDEAEFIRRVSEAAGDDEIVAWVLATTTPEARAAYNEQEAGKRVADRLDTPHFLDRYPLARELPPETSLLDLLAADDAACFRRTTPG